MRGDINVKNYLSLDGLAYFLNKILSKFTTKEELDGSINNLKNV